MYLSRRHIPDTSAFGPVTRKKNQNIIELPCATHNPDNEKRRQYERKAEKEYGMVSASSQWAALASDSLNVPPYLPVKVWC
jgi:hypothetical protein